MINRHKYRSKYKIWILTEQFFFSYFCTVMYLFLIFFFHQTLRYGALSFGVIYGFVHHASLSSSAKQDRLYHEKLAQYQNFLKAREAFQHHQQPHHHHHDSSSSSCKFLFSFYLVWVLWYRFCKLYGIAPFIYLKKYHAKSHIFICTTITFLKVITDPENPKFDLEKIIEFYAAKA